MQDYPMDLLLEAIDVGRSFNRACAMMKYYRQGVVILEEGDDSLFRDMEEETARMCIVIEKLLKSGALDGQAVDAARERILRNG